jgi:hypothetical protein
LHVPNDLQWALTLAEGQKLEFLNDEQIILVVSLNFRKNFQLHPGRYKKPLTANFLGHLFYMTSFNPPLPI